MSERALAVFPRLVRWISGTLVSSISYRKAASVKRRQQVPGPVRPALPLRWLAAARLSGYTCSASIPICTPSQPNHFYKTYEDLSHLSRADHVIIPALRIASMEMHQAIAMHSMQHTTPSLVRWTELWCANACGVLKLTLGLYTFIFT